MNQFAIYEVGVARLCIHGNQHLGRIVVAEPFFAIIRLFLIECQIHGLIRLLIPLVLNLVQIGEPLTSLGRCRSTQSFVVFDFPAGQRVGLLPLEELGQ